MFKVKGVISKIGEVKTLDNGAKVLEYVVDVTSENGYVTKHKFGMYKKEEHSEHVDNFIKFNKVGDNVEVEFNIRHRDFEWKDGTEDVQNILSHWKIEKIGQGGQEQPKEENDLLPF